MRHCHFLSPKKPPYYSSSWNKIKRNRSSSEQNRRYLRKFSKSSAIVPSITVCQQSLKFNGAISRSDAIKIPERGQAIEKKIL